MERDPAARSRLEMYLLYSGFRLCVLIARPTGFEHNMKFIARWISQRSRHKTELKSIRGQNRQRTIY